MVLPVLSSLSLSLSQTRTHTHTLSPFFLRACRCSVRNLLLYTYVCECMMSSERGGRKNANLVQSIPIPLALFSLSSPTPSRSLSFFVSGSSIPLLEKMSLCVEDDDATNAKKLLTHCLPIRFINCSNLSHLPTITGHAIFYRTDSPKHTHTHSHFYPCSTGKRTHPLYTQTHARTHPHACAVSNSVRSEQPTSLKRRNLRY